VGRNTERGRAGQKLVEEDREKLIKSEKWGEDVEDVREKRRTERGREGRTERRRRTERDREG